MNHKEGRFIVVDDLRDLKITARTVLPPSEPSTVAFIRRDTVA